MNRFKLERGLEEVLDFYNKTRGVEAQARILEIRDDSTVMVEFTGKFCYTCGVKDWVEDFAYLAISMGHQAKLIEYVEPLNEEKEYKRLGVFIFKPRNGHKSGGPNE